MHACRSHCECRLLDCSNAAIKHGRSHRPLVSSASLNQEYLSLLAPNLQRQEVVRTPGILPNVQAGCQGESSVLTSGGQSHSPQALSHPGGRRAAAGQNSSVNIATEVAWAQARHAVQLQPTSAPGYLQARGPVKPPAHQSLMGYLLKIRFDYKYSHSLTTWDGLAWLHRRHQPCAAGAAAGMGAAPGAAAAPQGWTAEERYSW